MAKITDLTVKGWLSDPDNRFENKSCGNGLYLVYRESMAAAQMAVQVQVQVPAGGQATANVHR
ncbi:hypothetical protein [Methyloglobulus sp.]|uniref:hypothetical protein n=1 Tax=Methyloglobulus sp. TaxID=2518622 RepID=UPI0032B7B353